MNCDDKLYTLELDGTIQKWYVDAHYGSDFSVSTVRNPKLKDYKRYYHMDDIGKKIFFTRKEANESFFTIKGEM